MKFAQFYHPSTGWNGTDHTGPRKLIPACGDRSVLILDGRLSLARQAMVAREACKARGYNGFSLHAGESLMREQQVRGLEVVTPID